MSKQCLDCPYALIKEKDNKQSRTRLNKLMQTMELIRQAYSLRTNEITVVMGVLYDFVLKEYPGKSRLVWEDLLNDKQTDIFQSKNGN